MGVMKAGADRAARDAEGVGDGGGLVPDVVAQDEDRPFLRRQSPERAIHDIAVDHAREFIARGVVGEVEDFELGVPAAVPTSVLDAHVREHAMDPEVEPVRIAEVPQVTPGDHQRILQGILGPVDVVEDPIGRSQSR